MRAKRVDSNQSEVVKAFRKLGCWVFDLSAVGKGLPDLLISVPPHHVLALCEIKDGEKSPSRRKLTKAEEEFHEECPSMVWIIKDLEDVRTLVRYYRQG